MQVVILGAGGHGQVVADILLCMNQTGENVRPVAYLDDDPALIGQTHLGIPVLGSTADLPSTPHEAIIIAIGNNRIRQRVHKMLLAQGERLTIARHPTAVIAADARLEPGCMICANVVINPGSVIGSSVILNTGCTIDHHNHIGNFAHIAPGVHLGGDVYVGEGALVGIGATVMPQRRIGEWSQIGAGAVVVDDILDGVTAVGIPARPLQKRTPCSSAT